MAGDVGQFVEGHRRLARMQQMVGIHAMDDLDMMAAFGKGVREAVYLNGVAAETVGRIERGEMQEIEGPAHRCSSMNDLHHLASGGVPGEALRGGQALRAHAAAQFFRSQHLAQGAFDGVFPRLNKNAAFAQ